MAIGPVQHVADRAYRMKLRRWRSVQGVGGLLLMASFFMPMMLIQSCSSIDVVVPSEDVLDFATSGVPDPFESLYMLAFVAPYVFGLLCVIHAWRQRTLRPSKADKSGWLTALLFGGAAGAYALLIVIPFALDASAIVSVGEVVIVVIILASCVYWLRAVQMGPGGRLSMRCYMAVGVVISLIFYAFYGNAMYGLCLSVFGACLIAYSCLHEACLLTGESTWPTLKKLARGRLQFYELPGPRCRQCNYLLIGLTSNRCPECGTEFSPDQAPAAPTDKATPAPQTA